MANAPSTDNYSLGKGILYLDRLSSAGARTGELDLGNAPAFNISLDYQMQDHFESRAGLKERDLQVETSISAKVNFTLDEINTDNLAIAFRATEPTTTSQGSGSVAAESVTARHDKWVDLDYRNVDHVAIAGFTEGTDFEVDFKVGRLKALSTGSITDEEALSVDYDYSSETWNIVTAISNGDPIEAYLRFVGDPEQGPAYEAEIWKVKVRMTGDASFISDDWATLEFEGEIQKDYANHPTEPWFKIREEGTSGGGS